MEMDEHKRLQFILNVYEQPPLASPPLFSLSLFINLMFMIYSDY